MLRIGQLAADVMTGHIELPAVLLQLLQGHLLPDRRHLQVAHEVLLRPRQPVGLRGEAERQVLLLEVRVGHGVEAREPRHHGGGHLHGAEAPHGDAAGLPRGPHEGHEELLHQLCPVLRLAPRLHAALDDDALRLALLLQLGEGEPLPDQHPRQPVGEVLPPGAHLRRQAPLQVLLAEVLLGHRLEAANLSEELLRDLVVGDPLVDAPLPPEAEECSPHEPLHQVAPLQAVRGEAGGEAARVVVVVAARAAAPLRRGGCAAELQAVPPELLQRQLLPDDHGREAADQVLLLPQRLEGQRALPAVRPQLGDAPSLEAVGLVEEAVGHDAVREAPDRDASLLPGGRCEQLQQLGASLVAADAQAPLLADIPQRGERHLVPSQQLRHAQHQVLLGQVRWRREAPRLVAVLEVRGGGSLQPFRLPEQPLGLVQALEALHRYVLRAALLADLLVPGAAAVRGDHQGLDKLLAVEDPAGLSRGGLHDVGGTLAALGAQGRRGHRPPDVHLREPCQELLVPSPPRAVAARHDRLQAAGLELAAQVFQGELRQPLDLAQDLGSQEGAELADGDPVGFTLLPQGPAPARHRGGGSLIARGRARRHLAPTRLPAGRSALTGRASCRRVRLVPPASGPIWGHCFAHLAPCCGLLCSAACHILRGGRLYQTKGCAIGLQQNTHGAACEGRRHGRIELQSAQCGARLEQRAEGHQCGVLVRLLVRARLDGHLHRAAPKAVLGVHARLVVQERPDHTGSLRA
mmetsp:Transcript_68420/g.192968  ORF Transcript_68420/g.192968 Transcript_68420/m.192968 type:complete len:748 (+) Transcript_68420:1396-3639(+)